MYDIPCDCNKPKESRDLGRDLGIFGLLVAFPPGVTNTPRTTEHSQQISPWRQRAESAAAPNNLSPNTEKNEARQGEARQGKGVTAKYHGTWHGWSQAQHINAGSPKGGEGVWEKQNDRRTDLKYM
ncbi:predicted protein [Verticillium alfalfae VaMs.102]|uniref:Predicted protein n=1 Tax=Verticillium alfalfae (strain VaMs.102 / ATCC MYA-4576 / FGSC 10136) TaxID=526221 RepID=C9SML2_VERA1|nr:predicted protein [Verticillium alfalfae VaMs.102]EEY20027.1 predicted protein [Verticillium alfalfae VaMs.102]